MACRNLRHPAFPARLVDRAGTRRRGPALLNQPAGPDNLTPLHEAIRRDEHELVRLLLAAGADLAAIDTRYHATPLGWARALNRVEIIPLLEARTKE